MNLTLHRYSDREHKELLSSVIVLVDTREKENHHIIKYFENNKINYKPFTLKSGDYSFYIPKNDPLSIPRDLFFDEMISIERKASLEELSGNFTTNRERFEREFQRADAKISILVEGGSMDDILQGNYGTSFHKNSYFASLLSFKMKYNLDVLFCKKENSGRIIHSSFQYYLKGFLKTI